MLSRAQRLTTAAFAMAFREGRVLRHPLLHLRAYRKARSPQNTFDQSTLIAASKIAASQTNARVSVRAAVRAAFVVPKKLGPATFRNRLRRRLRESYRHATRERRAESGDYDLIFLATPAADKATTPQIEAAISQLLNRLGADSARFSSKTSRRTDSRASHAQATRNRM